MKKLLILTTILFNFSTLVLAESKLTIAPYISYASYDSISSSDSNSTDSNTTTSSMDNKNDTIVGIYALMDEGKHSFELAAEFKYLNYSDGNSTDRITQADFVAAFKTSLTKQLKLNTLLYYISSNIAQSDGTIIPLLGLNYTNEKNYNFGIQAAYSIYSSKALASKMFQLKPSFSSSYGHLNSPWGIIYPKISLYYIKPIFRNTTMKSSYLSTEMDIIHRKGKFTNKVSYWFGEQVYAVKDDGFTVYNLNELHESGFTLSSRYKIDDTTGIKASYQNQYYKTFGSTEEKFLDRITIVGDFTF